MSTQEIRVRFAPSPTGQLHIGSARTAFFNWVFAKKNKGKFIIRIEDTDMQRHLEDTVDTIFDSLKWLGLDWDEGPLRPAKYGPYRQSQRLSIYKDYALKLLDEKKAYRCFCSPEELQEKREKNKKEKTSFEYDGKCLLLSEEEISKKLQEKKEFTIRLKVAENKLISFTDSVYGKIDINSGTIDDFILLRSNQMPTYNFSTAIDDFLMKITHVIRGEDHLVNTARQILVYDALGFDYPEFTHLPMILGSDGTKLSKRHGSVSIEKYREEGFIPQAILNCLALLGWAYDDKTTIFSVEDMISKFELGDINKKPAMFDYEKLLHVNSAFLKKMDDGFLSDILLLEVDKIKKPEDIHLAYTKEDLTKMIAISKERARTFKELALINMPFFSLKNYSDDAISYFKNKDIEPKEVLDKCLNKLTLVNESFFNCALVEPALRDASSELGLSFKKTAEVLRIALWGGPVSLPLFETIEILGKEITLKRIQDYLSLI